MSREQPMPAPVIPSVAQPPAPFSAVGVVRESVRSSVGGGLVRMPTTPAAARPMQQQQQEQDAQLQQQQQQQQPAASSPTEINVAQMGLTSLAVVISTAHAHCVKLDASKNRITAVPRLSYFRDLRTVTLANNGITSIESGAFNGMNNLEFLDLQGNLITSVPSDAFTGCTSMKVLNLRGNQLTKAPGLAKCGVLELLLDGNRIQKLQSFPDDVGMDAWVTVKRLGLSNNGVKDWGELRYLAAMEHLEAIDLRGNPFQDGIQFDYRHLMSWICPLLNEVSGSQLSAADYEKTHSLFHDAKTGGISDQVLLLDNPQERPRLSEYLARTIPKPGAVVGGGGKRTVGDQQFTAMGKKIKEMSQIVRVLHGAHMVKRKQAAGKIQAWYKAISARSQLPYEASYRLKKLSIYGWPVLKKVEPSRLSSTINQEAAVQMSRREAFGKRAIYSWEDNPRRLILRPCMFNLTPLSRLGFKDRAAVKIQKVARGFLVRFRLEQIRLRFYAVLTIQAVWKGYCVRAWKKTHRESFKTGVVVRSLEHKVTELTEQNQLLQNALRVLWNESRGMQLYLTRIRHRAATKIQSTWKMHYARKRVRSRRVKYLAYWRAYKTPLMTLQRVLRGYNERVKISQEHVKHRSAVDMQRTIRGHLARTKAEGLRERQRDRDEIRNLQKQVTMLFSMVKELAEREPRGDSIQQPQEEEDEEDEQVLEDAHPVVAPPSTGLRFIGTTESESTTRSPSPPSAPYGMGSSVSGMGLPLKTSTTSLGVTSSISAIHESLRLQQARRQEQQEQLQSYMAGIGLTTRHQEVVVEQYEEEVCEDDFELHELHESPLQQIADEYEVYEGEQVAEGDEELQKYLQEEGEVEEEEEEEQGVEESYPEDPSNQDMHYRFNDLISPPSRAPPSPPRASHGHFDIDDDTSL